MFLPERDLFGSGIPVNVQVHLAIARLKLVVLPDSRGDADHAARGNDSPTNPFRQWHGGDLLILGHKGFD